MLGNGVKKYITVSPHGLPDEVLPFIYVFIGRRCSNGDVVPMALAEDGTALAWHVCSNTGFASHDMGLASEWKRDRYEEHYPEGYRLLWVDDPEKHPGIRAAIQAAVAAKGDRDGSRTLRRV